MYNFDNGHFTSPLNTACELGLEKLKSSSFPSKLFPSHNSKKQM